MSEVRRRLRRRRLLQVAGGVVAAAVAIASVILVFNLRDATPLAPTADLDASDAEDLEESEAQGARLDGGIWRRVPGDADVFGVGREEPMADVTAGGPGLVAVGHDSRRQAGVVWVSEDGEAWERIPHQDAVFGGDRPQVMSAVTTGGPGLVAVGSDGDPAVWVSPDGLAWDRVALDEQRVGGEGQQVINAVVEAGPGVVAVGRDRDLGAAAVWVSPDGLEWERVEHDEEVFGGEGPQVMTSATAGGPGVVAVGDDRGTDGNAAVWVSPDGLEWERVEHDEEVLGGAGGQFMTSVTAHGDELVAVGHDFGVGSPAVWVSDDGLEWRRTVRDAGDLRGEPGLMNAVAAGGPGLVAVGQDHGDAVVWVSADAEHWERLADEEGVFAGDGPVVMRGVTATDNGLVAVGTDERAGQAAVWLGR